MLITFHELGNLDPFFGQTKLALGGVEYEFAMQKGAEVTLFNVSFFSPKGTRITIKTKLHASGRIFASEQFEVYLRRADKVELVYFGSDTEEIIGPNTQAAVEKALNDLVAEGQKINAQENTSHLLELDNLV